MAPSSDPEASSPLVLDRDRLVETMREQAEIGKTAEGGLHRLTLSDADREARDWLIDAMEDAGLSVRVDEIGNVFGRREGSDPDAAPVLVGSHLDSQPDGGIYDGALGVVAALETVRALNDEGLSTERPIEVVNWTNEEGSRYQPSLSGSGVWAGAYDLDEVLDAEGVDGTTLGEELERIEYAGDEPAEPREPYEAYLELHVEQGPYLEDAGADVGVVTGVVGYSWGDVTFDGDADHTGPTPMHDRRDALVAAADAVIGIRRLGGVLGDRTVASVGSLAVEPNSVNVVPGEVTLTWDVRDIDADVLAAGVERTTAAVERAAAREGVDVEWTEVMRVPPVEFPDRTVETVAGAATDLGYDAMRLPSGAGHDASYAAEVCDAGMVFAVSEDGVSHAPHEYTSWDDCHAAASVLAEATRRLAVTE